MNFFNLNIKKAFYILFLLILPIIIFTSKGKTKKENIISKAFFFTTSSIQNGYSKIKLSVQDTVKIYLKLIHTNKQNQHLLAENKTLKLLLFQMEELMTENTRLRKIIQFKKRHNVNMIVATIIGRDPLSEYQVITINRGSDHGVKQGMLVLADEGVVGSIFQVLPGFSQVILLTDPQSFISSMIKRSRVHGVLTGSSSYICKLKYLKIQDDVKVDDIILTSDPETMNAKWPIGKVIDIKETAYGASRDIRVQPFIKVSKLEEVFIITTDSPQE